MLAIEASHDRLRLAGEADRSTRIDSLLDPPPCLSESQIRSTMQIVIHYSPLRWAVIHCEALASCSVGVVGIVSRGVHTHPLRRLDREPLTERTTAFSTAWPAAPTGWVACHAARLTLRTGAGVMALFAIRTGCVARRMRLTGLGASSRQKTPITESKSDSDRRQRVGAIAIAYTSLRVSLNERNALHLPAQHSLASGPDLRHHKGPKGVTE